MERNLKSRAPSILLGHADHDLVFEREEQALRLEMRYDNDAVEFVVAVLWPDGRQQHERFTELEACRTWLAALENALEAERWHRQGLPIVLPYGWPDRRLT